MLNNTRKHFLYAQERTNNKNRQLERKNRRNDSGRVFEESSRQVYISERNERGERLHKFVIDSEFHKHHV